MHEGPTEQSVGFRVGCVQGLGAEELRVSGFWVSGLSGFMGAWRPFGRVLLLKVYRFELRWFGV